MNLTLLPVGVILLLLLNCLPGADARVRILKFNQRRNRKEGRCTANKVLPRNKIKLHYIAYADGQELVDTRAHANPKKEGKPVELIAGVAQTSWDSVLLYITCVGDTVTVLIEPPDIPYGGGLDEAGDKLAKGASVYMKVDVLSSETPKKDKLKDFNSHHFKVSLVYCLFSFFVIEHAHSWSQQSYRQGADSNKDGTLTLGEFQTYFKPTNITEGMAEYQDNLEILQQIFDTLDKNDDNLLSLYEYSDFKHPHFYDNTHMDPRDEFDFYDKDKDGKWNKKEVTAYFKSCNIKVPKQFWKHADKDEDSFISYAEFARKEMDTTGVGNDEL